METFDEGTPVTAKATFRDQDTDDLGDPDTVIFRFRLASTGSTVYTFTYPTDETVIRDSLGKFRCSLIGGAPGIWYGEAEGTGAIAAVKWDKFEIRASPFP